MDTTIELIKSEIVTFDLAKERAAELLTAAENALSPAEKFYALGIASYEMRQYSVAAIHLQASYVSESLPETAIRLALTYCRMLDFKNMETWAIKALELDPNGSFKMILFDSRIGYLSVFALSQFYLGRIDQALASAGKMRIASQADDMATDVLRLCYLARGEADKAEAIGGAAASLRDGSPPGLLRLAVGKEQMAFQG